MPAKVFIAVSVAMSAMVFSVLLAAGYLDPSDLSENSEAAANSGGEGSAEGYRDFTNQSETVPILPGLPVEIDD